MPHWVKSLLGTLVAVVSGSAAVATALLGKPEDFDVDARLILIGLCCLFGMLAVVIWSVHLHAFWRGVLALTILYVLAALSAYVVPRYHGLQIIRSVKSGTGSVGEVALWPPRSSAPTINIELSTADSTFEPTGFRVTSKPQRPKRIEFSGVTSTTATITIESFHHPMGLTIGFELRGGKARNVVVDPKIVEGDVPILQQDYQSSWQNPFLVGGLLWLTAMAVLFFLR